MALRRCTGSGAARALGLSLELDVHHTTVTAWEIKCEAALVAASRAYHAEVMDIMFLGRPEGPPCIA